MVVRFVIYLSVNKAIIRTAAYFGCDLSVKSLVLRMGKGFYLESSVKSLVSRMALDNLIRGFLVLLHWVAGKSNA